MWSNSNRPPDSREEDSWLSDEQMRHVAPAENGPFHSPVPTRMVGNGEYMPAPQTEKQKHVEYRIKELADEAAKKLGQTRRQFLAGTGGLAAAFIAMNEVHGKTFNVKPVEMYETAAYAENGVPRDLFVFDDQTHIIRSSMNTSNALRALAQGPGPASTAAGYTSNPLNGTGGNAAGPDEFGNPWPDWDPYQLHAAFPPNSGPATTAAGQFHLGEYILADVPAVPGQRLDHQQREHRPDHAARRDIPVPASDMIQALSAEILTGWQTSQCRDFINNLAGSRRAFAHAQLYPGVGNLHDPAFGDYTQWQIDFCEPDSWKGYNIAYAASAAPGTEFMQWRLDSETLAYPMYAVIAANKNSSRSIRGSSTSACTRGCRPTCRNPTGRTTRRRTASPATW